MGEHAVVYGKHAIAVPMPLAVACTVRPRSDGLQRVRVAPWQLLTWTFLHDCPDALSGCLRAILDAMGLQTAGFDLDIIPCVPRGSGLGASAAMAVAVARALSEAYGLDLSESAINDVGFASERIAHGTPSGVDNTVATFAKPLLFRKTPPLRCFLTLPSPLTLVVGFSGKPGMTHAMVAAVAALRQEKPKFVEGIMAKIDGLSRVGRAALEEGKWRKLGSIMNENQQLLSALSVSSPELDALIEIARRQGALGAKLTGGGGGGAMIALCDGNETRVAKAMVSAGFEARTVVVS